MKTKTEKDQSAVGYMIRRVGTTNYSNGKDSPYFGTRSKKIWRTLGQLQGHLKRVDTHCKMMVCHGSPPTHTVSSIYKDCEVVELKAVTVKSLDEELFVLSI